VSVEKRVPTSTEALSLSAGFLGTVVLGQIE
jgi:hypothetical protein